MYLFFSKMILSCAILVTPKKKNKTKTKTKQNKKETKTKTKQKQSQQQFKQKPTATINNKKNTHKKARRRSFKIYSVLISTSKHENVPSKYIDYLYQHQSTWWPNKIYSLLISYQNQSTWMDWWPYISFSLLISYQNQSTWMDWWPYKIYSLRTHIILNSHEWTIDYTEKKKPIVLYTRNSRFRGIITFRDFKQKCCGFQLIIYSWSLSYILAYSVSDATRLISNLIFNFKMKAGHRLVTLVIWPPVIKVPSVRLLTRHFLYRSSFEVSLRRCYEKISMRFSANHYFIFSTCYGENRINKFS